MENLKICLKKQYELSLLENVVLVEPNDRFAKDVFTHEDLNYYSYELNKNKAESFDKLYQLDIKINSVGKITFFFLKETVNKDTIINNIQSLKTLTVENLLEKQNKLDKLLEIISTHNPLFALFSSDEKEIIPYEFFNNSPIKIIYVKPDIKKIEKANKKHGKFGSYFLMLGKEKLSVLFLLLTTLILSFVTLLGVYNCYPNNAVYIFFFICSAALTTLNFFIYRDILKKYNIKSSMFVSGIILNIFGAAAGVGIFIAYYNALTNIPESVPMLSTLILIGISITIILILLSIITEILIKKLIKKK